MAGTRRRAVRRDRPTLEDVAVRAGVGRGTVSRVINGSPRVSERARAAVEQAVADLGYVPNRVARALAANRADAVALVIPEPETRLFAEPYFSDIIRGVSAELADVDLQLLLTLIRTPAERQRFADYLSAHRVDGVLLVSVHADDPLPDLLERIEMPAVLSGRRSAHESVPYVDSDNAGGGRAAVEHLIGRGRRAVATITGPLDMYVAQCRLDGYRAAVLAAGREVDEDLVVTADFTEEGGRAAMHRLLRQRPDLDAVFAASDVMAVGARQVLREQGRRVPDDVALVGFEDSAVARHTDPPLTSVRQATEEMGRVMVRVLIEQIEEAEQIEGAGQIEEAGRAGRAGTGGRTGRGRAVPAAGRTRDAGPEVDHPAGHDAGHPAGHIAGGHDAGRGGVTGRGDAVGGQHLAGGVGTSVGAADPTVRAADPTVRAAGAAVPSGRAGHRHVVLPTQLIPRGSS